MATRVPEPETFENTFSCAEFQTFKEALLKLRKLDDNIHILLNRTDAATDAVDCATVWSRLSRNYAFREGAIRRCIGETEQSLPALEETARGTAGNSPEARRLALQQSKLSLLKTELDVEAITRDRTSKLFHRKCRSYHIPPPAGEETDAAPR